MICTYMHTPASGHRASGTNVNGGDKAAKLRGEGLRFQGVISVCMYGISYREKN